MKYWIKKLFSKKEPKIEITKDKAVISNIDFTKPIDEQMKKHLELLGLEFSEIKYQHKGSK